MITIIYFKNFHNKSSTLTIESFIDHLVVCDSFDFDTQQWSVWNVSRYSTGDIYIKIIKIEEVPWHFRHCTTQQQQLTRQITSSSYARFRLIAFALWLLSVALHTTSSRLGVADLSVNSFSHILARFIFISLLTGTTTCFKPRLHYFGRTTSQSTLWLSDVRCSYCRCLCWR